MFELDGSMVDWSEPRITLIDDQLTDKTVYAYTFFYEDEIEMEADPMFRISDHMKWSNLIVFAGETESDDVVAENFYMAFSISNNTMDIGVGKS